MDRRHGMGGTLQLRLGYVVEQGRAGLGLYLAPTLPVRSWNGADWVSGEGRMGLLPTVRVRLVDEVLLVVTGDIGWHRRLQGFDTLSLGVNVPLWTKRARTADREGD